MRLQTPLVIPPVDNMGTPRVRFTTETSPHCYTRRAWWKDNLPPTESDIDSRSPWRFDSAWMTIECGTNGSLTLETEQHFSTSWGSYYIEEHSKLELILSTKHIHLPQNLHTNSQLVNCCLTDNKTLVLVVCKRIRDDEEEESDGDDDGLGFSWENDSGERELWGVTYYDIQNEKVDGHYPSVVQRLTEPTPTAQCFRYEQGQFYGQTVYSANGRVMAAITSFPDWWAGDGGMVTVTVWNVTPRQGLVKRQDISFFLDPDPDNGEGIVHVSLSAGGEFVFIGNTLEDFAGEEGPWSIHDSDKKLVELGLDFACNYQQLLAAYFTPDNQFVMRFAGDHNSVTVSEKFGRFFFARRVILITES